MKKKKYIYLVIIYIYIYISVPLKSNEKFCNNKYHSTAGIHHAKIRIKFFFTPKWDHIANNLQNASFLAPRFKLNININIINHHQHHHHVVPLARISLTLSRHFSLSFIAFGRSSGLHPVSSHSCCMYVRAGRPAFAWPYAGVYKSASLMSSSLLLQQCPTCLVRLTWIVFVMRGRWPYSWWLVGCCRQD